MADDDQDEGQAAAEGGGESAGKKPKKKLFLIIGIAVAVLGGGGGAAFFLMGGDDEAAVPSQPSAEGSAPVEGADGATAQGEAPPEGQEAAASSTSGSTGSDEGSGASAGFGETFTFKPFHLNLGNPLENHYIKVDVAIEYKGGEKQKEEIDKRLPQLRDAIGDVISSKSREFLLGPDGKAQLRREMLIRLNRYMNTPLESVYITDMLVE